MTNRNFSGDNHFVPQSYLRRWESSPGMIWVYHRLVSHERVPLWTEKSIKGIGFRQHLYTLNLSGEESDAIERRFAAEFETPAQEAIQKALSEERLTQDDWRKIIRFFALQDVRTPGRLKEYLASSAESTSTLLKQILEGLPANLEAIKAGDVIAPNTSQPASAFPLLVTTEIAEGEEFGTLKVETAVGRASWLHGIQHLLEKTANVLYHHKWTIMRPAEGMRWPTSDKPSIRLNYFSNGQYNFGGGWGSPGTKLLLPLDPEHLLYTQIGARPPKRGTRFSAEHTGLIQRIIVNHADRMVFSNHDDPEIPALIPRYIDADLFKYEEEQWRNWYAEQKASESRLLAKPKTA